MVRFGALTYSSLKRTGKKTSSFSRVCILGLDSAVSGRIFLALQLEL